MEKLLADPGKPDHYLFVIDTEEYAGNFEREMYAYVTGQVGECEVGEEVARMARKKDASFFTRLEDLVKSIPDELGDYSPVSIFPTPGWFNNGVDGHYRLGQEVEALAHYKQQVEKRAREAPLAYAERHRDKVRTEEQKKVDEANALTEVPKHHAYQSVAIYLHKIPGKDLIETMKKRALEIANEGMGFQKSSKPTITGFRLLEQRTAFTELPI